MISKIFCGTVLGTLCMFGAQRVLGAELRGVQLVPQADAAQLALELDQAVAPNLFALEHPYRIVIDLKRTHRAPGLRPPAPAGAVTALRFGVQPGGTLRIVIETQAALPFRYNLGSPGQLLVSLGHYAAPALRAEPPPVRAPHAPEEGGRDVIVAVDAGHGGLDPGAIGHGGTREKEVTLAIARALAERLNAEGGMRAVMTRDRDEFLELRERIRRARVARADMFVSVHADSIADRSVSGSSVYVLSVHGASSEAARWLAERENSADLVAGTRAADQDALEPVLIDMAQTEMIGVSATAAERVVSALEGVGAVRK